MMPGPEMTGPSFPLRFGGSRSSPRPPFSSFPSETSFRLVVKNRAEFTDYWNRLTANMPPENKALMPEIDFAKEMIVVSAMGVRPSHGPYFTFIDGACEVDGQIEVFVSTHDDRKCGGGFATLSYPADAVRIPRSDLPVVFRETQISCADMKKFRGYE